MVSTKQIYSGKVKDVATADHEIDDAYNSLKAFLNGYRKLQSAPNSQSAEDLYSVFKTFGLDLDRFSYSDTTLRSLRDDKPWANESTIKRYSDTTSVRVGF